MATIGVLTYTLPHGLKLNKNFNTKEISPNSSSLLEVSNHNNNNNSLFTKIEDIGMIGTDVIVMRTKQKFTPLHETSNNIQNKQKIVKQIPAKKQKVSTVKNVIISAMPLTNIINTSNTTSNVPSNFVTNVISNIGSNIAPSISTESSNNITTITTSVTTANQIPIKQPNKPAVISLSLPKPIPSQTNTLNKLTTPACTTKQANQSVCGSGRKSTPLPHAVARRNARERNRVKQVNNGFAALRERIPEEVAEAFEAAGNGRGSNKKLSKVETLRMAVEYIRSLERILGFEYSSFDTDGLMSPLPSDDDILFNSTAGFVSPLPATPPMLQQQLESSLIKTETSNSPSPLRQNSIEEHGSLDENNSSLYDQDDNDIFFPDNLPDVTTINGQQYLRILGTNTYQLITPDMLENEENIHPTHGGLPTINNRNNFIDNIGLISSSIQQNNNQPQLLPSMPFTSTNSIQQQQHQLQHQHQPQSISPLTVNCVSDNTPALVSPDQFSNTSSNISGCSLTGGHNNDSIQLSSLSSPALINQHFHHQHHMQHQQQQQQQHERNLLAQLHHLHHIQPHLLKIKMENQNQPLPKMQYSQTNNQQLAPNSSPLSGHDFDGHGYSTLVTAGNDVQMYDGINIIGNSNSDDNSNNLKRKIKIEGDALLDAAAVLSEESMMEAIEWWEAHTPKSDEC